MIYGNKKSDYYYPASVHVVLIPESVIARILSAITNLFLLLIRRPRKAIGMVSYFRRTYKSLHRTIADACLAMMILRDPPHILHIQWAKSIVNLKWLIEMEVCKVVISLRGTHINSAPVNDEELAANYRNIFPSVAGFHAVSNAIAKIAMLYNASEDRISVIYSIVTDSFFNAYRPGKQKDKQLIKILSVGRFHPVKGYVYALEAVRILQKKGLSVSYTILAEGEPDAALMDQLSEGELANAVSIQREITHEKLPEYLQQFDVMLLSSVEEGLANVVLEAMAAGLPVISTDCGGMHEVVTKDTGWLVPVKDPRSIAEAVERFLATPQNRIELMRRTAHESIKEKCSERHQIDKFLSFYKKIIRIDE